MWEAWALICMVRAKLRIDSLFDIQNRKIINLHYIDIEP